MTRSIFVAGLLTVGLAASLEAGEVLRAAEPIPGQYIIVLRHSEVTRVAVPDVARELLSLHKGRLRGVYQHALKGFSANMTAKAAQALADDPRVAFVEEDGVARITAQTVPTGIRRVFADDNPNLQIDGQDNFRADVDIAIIDTGTESRPELNVVARTNCVSGTCNNGQGQDDHGHGTHVAGTAAAIDNGEGVVGVAPGARIWSVKVLNNQGSGSFSAIAAGIDWVAARSADIEVINMSLGGQGSNQAITNAINTAVRRGIVVAVSAGNSNQNAQNFTPAHHPDVITVSALADFNGEPGGGAASTCRSDQDDTLASFSNWGATIEITAPGVCIVSTVPTSGNSCCSHPSGLLALSGTSMASPHVAGAAALLASGSNKPTDKAGVDRIIATLRENGNFNWTDDSGDGVKEPLLDVHSPDVFPPRSDGNQPPRASFTRSCNDSTLTCSFDGSGSSDPDGTITDFAWDFGDGTTGRGRTVSHAYARAGLFTVMLTLTDNGGRKGSTSQQIRLGPNQPPRADFTSNCNLPIQFCILNSSGSTDPDGTVVEFTWNFGDGSAPLTTTDTQIAHRFPRAGTFSVKLTAKDNEGATASVTKNVNPR